MLGFITDELVWAVQRERAEEVRNIHPHTAIKADKDRAPLERDDGGNPLGTWIAASLRAGFTR